MKLKPARLQPADRIALLETGVPFERDSADLKRKRSASEADFNDIPRRGYVQAMCWTAGNCLPRT